MMATHLSHNPGKSTTSARALSARAPGSTAFRLHPAHPSDSLVKWAFKQARHAESLLSAIFPSAVRALVQPGTTAIEDSGHVNAELQPRHGDLLLSQKLRGENGRLLVLIEQQRKPDNRMMLRTCDYMIRAWRKRVSAHAPRCLPPMVAILLYNGDRPWNAPFAFQDMVRLPPSERGWLARHTPHFKMHLVELRGGRISGLAEDRLTPLARLVLWCLSVVRDDELFGQGLLRMAGPLRDVLRGPEPEDALEALLRYLAATHPTLSADKIRTMLEETAGPRGQEVIVSFLDEIRNEGRTEGLAEGRAEGRAEAREVLAATLLQLLSRRFGPVPPRSEAKIRKASIRAVQIWILRVLTAETLEQVLEPKLRPARRNEAKREAPSHDPA